MSEDPYIWLENLEDDRTKEFISRHNKRFKELVDDYNKRFIDRYLKYYKVPYIVDHHPVKNGIFILTRDSNSYKIKYIQDGEERMILDSKDIDKDTVISAIYPYEDSGLLGFFYNVGGSDEGRLRIISLDNAEILDELSGTITDITWIDKDKYFYIRFYRKIKTPDGIDPPAERVFLREIGKKYEEMIFGEGIPTKYMLNIRESWDKAKIFITVQYGWIKSKIYGGLVKEYDKWDIIFDGGDYLTYPAGYHGKYYYIYIYDRNGLGRILRVSGDDIKEVIGEWSYPLKDALVIGDEIILNYLVDASNRIKIFNVNGNEIKYLKFNKPVTIKSLKYYYNKIYILVESFDNPPIIYSIDNNSLKEYFGYKIDLDISVDEGFINSFDGTKIHYFRVRNRDKDDGVALIYGYGGFGISITPFYISNIGPFIEDGGVYIVVNLRGGGEYGEKWHKAGVKENKINVFRDYISISSHFKDKGYKIVGWGVSNGGLLISAVSTMKPDSLDIAIIGYPVIDMLRFHKLYIGYLWTTEYGDPDNASDRVYLSKYSPYHNIKNGVKYPKTLVYTGLNDDRVHPAHAFKYVARLEEVGADIYLRVETSSGHMGASPIIKIKEYADILAFIYKALGIV